MDFEWDDDKSERNEAERGFGFAYAAQVFLGRHLVAPSYPGADGEARFLAIGEIEGVVYAVIFADRDDARRIISARRASRRERKRWLE